MKTFGGACRWRLLGGSVERLVKLSFPLVACALAAGSLGCSADSGSVPGGTGGTSSDAGTSGGADGGTEDSAGQTPENISGWISVIEWNDTCDQWYLRTDWLGGVRAYFAEELTFQRSLPHHTGFLNEVETQGSCTLYDSGLVPDDIEWDSAMAPGPGNPAFDYIDFKCGTDPDSYGGQYWCELDQECRRVSPPTAASTEPGDGTACIDLPAHFDVGDIAISGLASDIKLEPDELDRYYQTSGPTDDLFDSRDILNATTSGGALEPFTLEARGVEHLELGAEGVLDLADGQRVVSWTPAGNGARVQVAILTGAHDPNPVLGLILCDVPDADGSVEIPAEFVPKLVRSSYGNFQKCSRVTRYTKSTKTETNGSIELFVGSARNLSVIFTDSAQPFSG